MEVVMASRQQPPQQQQQQRMRNGCARAAAAHGVGRAAAKTRSRAAVTCSGGGGGGGSGGVSTVAGSGLVWQPNHSITRCTAKYISELYSVWHGRVGTSHCIPSEKVQQLFNDMHLYPTKSQVYGMLQYAKECASRNTAAYVTFNEFCVCAMDMKRSYERGVPRPVQRLLDRDGEDKKRRTRKMSKSMPKYEVFLGGSCNPTTWRQDLAIPSLKSLGITFYNPQVAHWAPELIELEHQAKESAAVLFFVMDNETRCVAGTVEVAYFAGKRRKLILVIHPYLGPGQKIWGEPISKDEYEDLATGQMVLQDLVERQGIPVFDSVPVALSCTAKVLRENLAVQDLGLEDMAQPVRNGHLQLGDKLVKLREAFDQLDTSHLGELCLEDVCMAFRILTNRDLSLTDLRSIEDAQTGSLDGGGSEVSREQVRVTFEQFCGIVAEFQYCEKWALDPRPLRSLPLAAPANNSQSNYLRDVYLGGSCVGTTWREDVAVPLLKKEGLTYFNPQQHCQWSKHLTPIEAAAMDNSYLLLFVIPATNRSLAAMAVAAHYIGLGCKVVLVIQHLPDDCVLNGDKLSTAAVKDNNRGRMYLSDLANRERVAVFDDIAEAVDFVVHKCCRRYETVRRGGSKP